MSTATTSRLPLPPTKQAATAAAVSPTTTAANRKHLHAPPKSVSFIPLSLSLAPDYQHLHRSQSLNKSNLQNPKNPPNFPLHGIVIDVVKGFTHNFSSFVSNIPLFAGNRHGGGTGRGNNRNFLSHIFCPPAMALEKKKSKDWDSHDLQANLVVQLNKLSRLKRYKVSDIKFLNPRTRAVINGADEAFSEMVDLQRGGVYTRNDLMERLGNLSDSGFFEKIEIDAKTNPDGSVDINIPIQEKVFSSKTKFRCISYGFVPEDMQKPIEMDPNMTEKEKLEFERRINMQIRKRYESGKECILPGHVQKEIESMLLQRANLSASLYSKIIHKIHKWYHENGYLGARVMSTSNPEANPGGEILYEVVEGVIKKLAVRFFDKLGNACEGNTNVGVIERALPEEVAVGKVYNERAFQKAMQNLHSLELFSQVKVDPQMDQKTGAWSAEIELQELPQKWSEVNTEWNIAPRRNGQLTLASFQPGATISFGHRNIKGLNRSFQGAITLSNLFEPEDDIGFNFEYTHPYLDGVNDPRNRTFQAICFNTRKLSPVFRGGPGVEDTPIFVDRVGAKATITEDYDRQSKFTYGLVVEDVKTRGEGGNIVARADILSADGQSTINGPPTTLSSTGIDRMAFFQANLTRDNTRFLNGAIVGDRDIFQIDQGLGLGAIFNRHKISTTRFIPLKKVEEGKGKAPPPVLVLHGLYGGCVGDLPNHEAFTIGGPHSVRGYNIGEIGASRSKLEVAAEIRVPVKGTYAYAFVEHGNDLGSSVEVRGNPTKSYMREGRGSSYGAGIKIGQLRAEYAIDNNTKKGGFFFHFGDRF